MARYRVGIIACGTIARAHARGWRSHPQTDLVAIADSNEEALKEFGEAWGIPPSTATPTTARCSTARNSISSASAPGTASTPK